MGTFKWKRYLNDTYVIKEIRNWNERRRKKTIKSTKCAYGLNLSEEINVKSHTHTHASIFHSTLPLLWMHFVNWVHMF